MSTNVRFATVLAGVLIVLAAVFLWFGHLKHARERELTLTGQDEQSQAIRLEADEYRIANRNQQIGVLAVGLAILLMIVVLWVRHGRELAEKPRNMKPDG